MGEKHYTLVDVNPYWHNCGHYPEWVVREAGGPLPDPVPATRRGTPLAYASEADACAAMDRLNRGSSASWQEYLRA